MKGQNLKIDTGKTKTVDLSTAIGVLLAFIFIAVAIIHDGNPKAFLDIRSILIVVLGTLAIVLASFSIKEMMAVPEVLVSTVLYGHNDPVNAAMYSIEAAKVARKKGLMELDKHQELYRHNQFFKSGVEMLVDQNAIEDVEKILSFQLQSMVDRHSKSVEILHKASEVAPAMGLIGTLIGLVQMLGSLDNASSIGPAMAVALLTTFYGAVLAYVVFLPLSSKLERNTSEELLAAQIYLQAIHAIAKKENPRKLEMVINGMLPSTKRIRYLDSVSKT